MNHLETLDEDFRLKIEQLISAISAVTGRQWVVTSGRRTLMEQKRIYAQGRTLPGPIVSNAPPGFSPHNFGMAADLAPLKPNGKDIDWNADRKLWKQMADLAVEMGMTAGYYFHSIVDMPHVEDPSWRQDQAAWKAGHLNVA